MLYYFSTKTSFQVQINTSDNSVLKSKTFLLIYTFFNAGLIKTISYQETRYSR